MRTGARPVLRSASPPPSPRRPLLHHSPSLQLPLPLPSHTLSVHQLLAHRSTLSTHRRSRAGLADSVPEVIRTHFAYWLAGSRCLLVPSLRRARLAANSKAWSGTKHSSVSAAAVTQVQWAHVTHSHERFFRYAVACARPALDRNLHALARACSAARLSCDALRGCPTPRRGPSRQLSMNHQLVGADHDDE